MNRVLAKIATAAMVGGMLFGVATEASASQIKSSGPYPTLTACNYGRQDLARFGVGVHHIQSCSYRAAYTDQYGRYLPAGWYFIYLLN